MGYNEPMRSLLIFGLLVVVFFSAQAIAASAGSNFTVTPDQANRFNAVPQEIVIPAPDYQPVNPVQDYAPYNPQAIVSPSLDAARQKISNEGAAIRARGR